MIVSYVAKRFEDHAWSGVPRFDWDLRRAFPGLVSPGAAAALKLIRDHRAEPDLLVVTDNHLSCDVPDEVRTVVVHHGCAQTHYERDRTWQTRKNRALCTAQREMYRKPNRLFAAPSTWIAREFSRHHGVPAATVIPLPAEPLPRTGTGGARPVVLGDWREFNKGKDAVARLRRAVPELEFRQLECTYATRAAAYAPADAWLCLSLSEGGGYSNADAEAAGLPTVSTEVGTYLDFGLRHTLPWDAREDTERVAGLVRAALAERRGPSFYETFTFEAFRRAWTELFERARSEALPPRLP